MQSNDFDSDTIATAKGLAGKLCSFETVTSLHVAHKIFKIMNPVTVTLQGVVLDYGGAQAILKILKENIKKLRKDEKWQHILSKVTDFLKMHDIPDPVPRRIRRRKRFMDEIGVDEPILQIKKKLKVELYFKLVDSLYNQLEDRFPDHSLKMVQQMNNFTHTGVLEINKKPISTINVAELCAFYKWDVDNVCDEVNSFADIYKATHENITMEDLLVNSKDSNKKEADSDDAEGDDHGIGKIKNTWIDKGFLNLTMSKLKKTLTCLLVTWQTENPIHRSIT